MSASQIIDMSKLPPPQVVQVLDFEAKFGELKADLIEAYPEAAAVLELESEPLTKWLQRTAYQLVNQDAKTNDSALAVMLAYATGADLDQLGAWYDTARLTITPADPDASPPVEAVMEDDDAFRERIHLAPRGFTTAGPEGAYIYHARSADGQVLDAWPHSPTPGQVVVTVLSRTDDGTPTPELLAKVTTALSSEDIRPMTDEVIVQGADILGYAVEAVIYTLPGPDSQTVLDTAIDGARAYAATMHRIKRTPTTTGFIAALQVAGVHRVDLISPAADIVCGDTQASWCTAFNITWGGTSE